VKLKPCDFFSGIELRRSKRAKVALGTKKAGRKVSIIPEELD
jgi:hypothetical protein